MTVLKLKKLQAELARVVAAKLEMEVRVEELQEALNRVKDQISIQEQKEIELKNEIKGE